MPYIIQTNFDAFRKSIELNQVSIPESFVNASVINNVKIKDEFYFYIPNENIFIGPNVITSKPFYIYDTINGFWNVNTDDDFKTEKSFRFFFSQKNNVKIKCKSILKSDKPLCFTEQEFNEYLETDIENDDSEYCNLIIEEESYLFSFTLIKKNQVFKITKKISDSWFKELIKTKEKVVNYTAKNDFKKCFETIYNFGELLYSFFVKGDDSFWNNLSSTVYLYVSGRAIFLPFGWIHFRDKELLLNKYKLIQCMPNNYSYKSKPLTINRGLIIADPSGTLPAAQIEAEGLYDFLNHKGVSTDIVSKNIQLMELKEYFEKYDLIHYVGHGEKGWQLSARRKLTPGKVPDFKNPPSLVVSSSCQTALNRGGENVINTFLQKNINWIIASDLKIPDKNLFDFFSFLYGEIINGESISEAYSKAILHNIKNNNIDWIYFNLYGNEKV